MQKKPQLAGDAKTIEREFKILNRFGIHARPAAMLVKTVSHFESDVTVCKLGGAPEPVPAKSIMGVLTLEGNQGAVLKFAATGPDAEEALDAIRDLIANKFFEE